RMQKQTAYYVIYNKYFKNSRASYLRATSNYSSINGEHISPYDDLIRAEAGRLGWDWRLLASLVFQESKFEPRAESWAGAKGLRLNSSHVKISYAVFCLKKKTERRICAE